MTLCNQPILDLIFIVMATTLRFATALTLGALSGVICERAGVVNIAIEGMMLGAAFTGYAAGVTSHNLGVAVLAAVGMGLVMALLHGMLSITYKVDQIISGTVINILGFGFTTYLYGQWFAEGGQATPGTLPTVPLPGLGSVPLLAVVAILLVFVLHFVLRATPWGLRVLAVGEHPKAVDTVGINVRQLRYQAVLVGGALAGLGGASYVPGYLSSFDNGMTAGAGFIALAAMIFGKWTPFGAWVAALFFGLTLATQNTMQSCGVQISPQIVGMLPYIITLLVLAGFVGRSTPPAADGVPY